VRSIWRASRAAQFAQIRRASRRIAQAPISLVRARSPLQGNALLGIAPGCKFVGMHPVLQLPVCGVERCAVDRKTDRQAEQLEMIVANIHLSNYLRVITKPATKKAAAPPF